MARRIYNRLCVLEKKDVILEVSAVAEDVGRRDELFELSEFSLVGLVLQISFAFLIVI